jgi:hypothetical protein
MLRDKTFWVPFVFLYGNEHVSRITKIIELFIEISSYNVFDNQLRSLVRKTHLLFSFKV